MENIIDRAIIFATNAHSGTMRKGTTIPYIVHPMEAGAIAAGLTDDYEVIAAAILHDTLEDTNTTFSSLKEAFGERVADLVAFESEDKQPERPANATWRERKQATIDCSKRLSDDYPAKMAGISTDFNRSLYGLCLYLCANGRRLSACIDPSLTEI